VSALRASVFVVALLGMLSGPAVAAPAWIDVNVTRARTCVIQNEVAKECWEDIAIGRFGASANKRLGDGMTPLGHYRIAWITSEHTFGQFLGIDYPDVDTARRAASSGDISHAQLQAIEIAHRNGELPPQNTPLGGYVGLHGVGQGDPEMHRQMNWTQGCVALDNAQLDALMKWVRLGMEVRIHL